MEMQKGKVTHEVCSFPTADACDFSEQPPAGTVCNPFVNNSINVTLKCTANVRHTNISWWREACGYKSNVANCTLKNSCVFNVTEEGNYACMINGMTSNEFRVSSDLDYSCFPSCLQKEPVQKNCEPPVSQNTCGSGSVISITPNSNKLCPTATITSFSGASVTTILFTMTTSTAAQSKANNI